MVFYIVFTAILFIIIFIFSSPRLSPIPYFPSNKKDMDIIVKSLDLADNQSVIDLGAGDGIVVFEAARAAWIRKLNTDFVAVEINPILIAILHIKRLLHPNRLKIKIIRGDIFRMDYKGIIATKRSLTFYLYISPWHMEKTINNISRQTKKYSVVSYMYPVKSLKSSRKPKTGVHSVFFYSHS